MLPPPVIECSALVYATQRGGQGNGNSTRGGRDAGQQSSMSDDCDHMHCDHCGLFIYEQLVEIYMVAPRSPHLAHLNAALMLVVMAILPILFLEVVRVLMLLLPPILFPLQFPLQCLSLLAFTCEEMNFIRRFIAQLDSAFTTASSSSVALAGTHEFVLSASSPASSPSLIIDSVPFFFLKVFVLIDKVHIANGSFVVGTNYIPIAYSLSPSFVFHVPNFHLNLVYVSHLTKPLNWSITFFPSFYMF